jgi:hypothetical protein
MDTEKQHIKYRDWAFERDNKIGIPQDKLDDNLNSITSAIMGPLNFMLEDLHKNTRATNMRLKLTLISTRTIYWNISNWRTRQSMESLQ